MDGLEVRKKENAAKARKTAMQNMTKTGKTNAGKSKGKKYRRY
jgi:hypothetical protein